MDENVAILANFFQAIADDPKVSAIHISLYAALFYQFSMNHFTNPMEIERVQIMERAKISSLATYFKYIHELHEYGYIKYIPAGHRYMKSVVSL
jgi:hypothetical protein